MACGRQGLQQPLTEAWAWRQCSQEDSSSPPQQQRSVRSSTARMAIMGKEESVGSKTPRPHRINTDQDCLYRHSSELSIDIA